MRTGILYASAAYIAWGLFPLYFKALQDIPPIEILLHRMVWSLVFCMLVLAWRKKWGWLSRLRREPKILAASAASAVLLSTNWFIYIWATNNGHVLDASLGYFITPLVNVFLGFLILRERMRVGQWSAFALAMCGVAWLTWQTGHLPWIGLMLAATFGTYGLLRKTAVLETLEGFSVETMTLFPFALGYLIVLTIDHHNAFLSAPPSSQWLLVAAGPITAIPLLMFSAGVRRIPLSLLGFLQYIAPSLQFLLGVWLYHEPLSSDRLIGFALIWLALALYSLEGAWRAWAVRPSTL
jgi:chloramphenicol-sensitive protein RarD